MYKLRNVCQAFVLLFALLASGSLLAESSSQSNIDENNNGFLAQEQDITSSSSFGPLRVTVQLDQTYCASGGVQCGQTGSSYAVAANGNNALVRLSVQVGGIGSGCGGLTQSDFTISTPGVPAGGTSLVIASCPSCFNAGSNGMYTLFVKPFGGYNWKSGSYFVQLRVNYDSTTYHVLNQIAIRSNLWNNTPSCSLLKQATLPSRSRPS